MDDVSEMLEPIRDAIDGDYDEMIRNNPETDPITAARSEARESFPQLYASEEAVEKAEQRSMA